MDLIASAFLGPVCERLVDTAIEKYKLVRDAEKEVKKLKSTVKDIKAVLQDAYQKQVGDPPVRFWLRDLKQFLLDAEDVLDEVATDAALRTRDAADTRSVTSRRAKVRTMISCFGCIHMLSSSLAIAQQIKAIRLNLNGLYEEREGLGLRLLVETTCLVPSRLDTTSLLTDESCIFGRDDEKKKMVQLLLASGEGSEPTSGKNKVHVFAIVGMGGVGKTTLAQLVFNDPTVKQHFPLRMWVCVSEDFDLKRITREIMDAVHDPSEKKELSEIVNWDSALRRLGAKIEEKRFLLVLDDMWEENSKTWESLCGPLMYGGQGSKIIVTTRKRRVSDVVKADPLYLSNLSSKDLWPIFKIYAFGRNDPHNHMLETIGRQINDRLNGSPLAARIIGRLLNKSFDVKFWKDTMQSKALMQEHPENDILPILKLSYDHLPEQLQQCFAYCSLFPKDHRFKKSDLTPLWTAQHFIQTNNDQYFNDLLNNSFFERDMARYDQFVMHDLIHDLAELVSGDDCFRLGEDGSKKIPETVRHMSLATSNFDLAKLTQLCEHGKLRTLLFLGGCTFDLLPHLDALFMKLKRLRVLGLRRCKITELPTSIGTLTHLRFVDLSENPINRLPESFGNLYNLQVLILGDRRLHGSLPSNMSMLTNLRHLQAHHELVSSIQGLGKLTALEKLLVSGRKVKELGEMSLLRKLKLLSMEEIASKDEATQARLNAKEHLDVLKLIWTDDRDGRLMNQTLEEEVIESLQPTNSIRELRITGYAGIKSPSWMEDPSWVSFSFLKTVELYDCRNWVFLPPLGQLPCLKSLTINGMRGVRQMGAQFLGCCADGGGGARVQQGFPSLEALLISNMSELEEWTVPYGDGSGEEQQHDSLLPRLKYLQIYGCPMLRELPALPHTLQKLLIDKVGLTHFPGWLGCRDGSSHTHDQMSSSPSSPSLTRLTIWGCPNLRELPALPRTLQELSINDVGLTHLPGWLGCRDGSSHTHDQMPSSPSSPSLTRFSIRRCPDLRSLDDGFLHHRLHNLNYLEVSQCKELESLPERAFGHLISLESLTVTYCPKLSRPPPVVMTGDDILPSSLQQVNIFGCGDTIGELLLASSQKLTSLSKLVVDVDFPSMAARFGELNTLTSLEIRGCPSLFQEMVSLPSSLENLSIKESSHVDDRWLSTCLWGLNSLKSLDIDNCPTITTFPKGDVMCRLPSLESLRINSCKELTCLWGRNSLKSLRIDNCPALTTFHDVLCRVISLEGLNIRRCKELTSLGGSPALVSLKWLEIVDCPKLFHLIEAVTGSTSSSTPLSPPQLCLKQLQISNSSPQQIIMWLCHCASLQSLNLERCPQLRCFDDGNGDDTGVELEVALLNLASPLRSLSFSYCENLCSLPSKLKCLSSLEDLSIQFCPKIQCLPEGGLPESLERLFISGCPALKERCEKEGSPDWTLISHIPRIDICG